MDPANHYASRFYRSEIISPRYAHRTHITTRTLLLVYIEVALHFLLEDPLERSGRVSASVGPFLGVHNSRSKNEQGRHRVGRFEREIEIKLPPLDQRRSCRCNAQETSVEG